MSCGMLASGRAMPEATRRPLESRAPQKKKEGPPRQRTKAPCQAEGPSAEEVMVAGRRREKRVAEAEEVREAYLQVSGKRPRGPSEDVAVLILDDEEGADAKPVNMACHWKVVPFVNCFIDGIQMELPELEQLPMKTLREQIAEAGKLIQDADLHAGENAAKIAELSLKLAEAEKEVVLRSCATKVEEAKKKGCS
ncbi:unnamed protein product [Prunus armeniaca]|uniref:Uncharacterized protein n=1 Tax=Prunus armeniaca TaxID=36596 RepID=A0A6J5XNE7_PRUAR|nr:unnamed protein product [Prunus armeniaca]